MTNEHGLEFDGVFQCPHCEKNAEPYKAVIRDLEYHLGRVIDNPQDMNVIVAAAANLAANKEIIGRCKV